MPPVTVVSPRPCAAQTVGADLFVKSVSIPETNTQVEFHMFDCGGQLVFNQREWGTKYVRARARCL
jgi:hypothetical protein